MRYAILVALACATVSCMQKQSDGTYRVANPISTDTAKARDNAARSGDELKRKVDEISKSDTAKKIKAESRELGRAAQEKLGQVAQTAGAKLREAGKKAEQDAKKSH